MDSHLDFGRRVRRPNETVTAQSRHRGCLFYDPEHWGTYEPFLAGLPPAVATEEWHTVLVDGPIGSVHAGRGAEKRIQDGSRARGPARCSLAPMGRCSSTTASGGWSTTWRTRSCSQRRPRTTSGCAAAATCWASFARSRTLPRARTGGLLLCEIGPRLPEAHWSTSLRVPIRRMRQREYL